MPLPHANATSVDALRHFPSGSSSVIEVKLHRCNRIARRFTLVRSSSPPHGAPDKEKMLAYKRRFSRIKFSLLVLVPTALKTIGFFPEGVIRARSLAVINLNVKTYDETAVIVMYLSFLWKMVRSDFEGHLLKGKREIDISRPIEIHNTVGNGFSRLTIRN